MKGPSSVCAVGKISGKRGLTGSVSRVSRVSPDLPGDTELLRETTACFSSQKDVLQSDLLICSVAAVLSFAVSASTVFLSLRV